MRFLSPACGVSERSCSPEKGAEAAWLMHPHLKLTWLNAARHLSSDLTQISMQSLVWQLWFIFSSISISYCNTRVVPVPSQGTNQLIFLPNFQCCWLRMDITYYW